MIITSSTDYILVRILELLPYWCSKLQLLVASFLDSFATKNRSNSSPFIYFHVNHLFFPRLENDCFAVESPTTSTLLQFLSSFCSCSHLLFFRSTASFPLFFTVFPAFSAPLLFCFPVHNQSISRSCHPRQENYIFLDFFFFTEVLKKITATSLELH